MKLKKQNKENMRESARNPFQTHSPENHYIEQNPLRHPQMEDVKFRHLHNTKESITKRQTSQQLHQASRKSQGFQRQ